MGNTTQSVDGQQPLDAQERALNLMEQTQFAQVISYSKGASGTSNDAVLQDVPIGQQPPPLHLEALAPNGETAPVIASQQHAGRKLVFQGSGFVSGKEQMILGFR